VWKIAQGERAKEGLHCSVVGFEGSAGYSQLIDQFEIPPENRALNSSLKKELVVTEGAFHLIRTLVEELDPEDRRACLNERIEVFRARLSPAVENGVSAPGIGLNGMFHSDPVPNGEFSGIAWATAISEVLPLRQKSAEQTVLHVEHRHVLVQCDLDHALRGGPQKIKQLVLIEIV